MAVGFRLSYGRTRAAQSSFCAVSTGPSRGVMDGQAAHTAVFIGPASSALCQFGPGALLAFEKEKSPFYGTLSPPAVGEGSEVWQGP